MNCEFLWELKETFSLLTVLDWNLNHCWVVIINPKNKPLVIIRAVLRVHNHDFLDPVPTGAGTIALDPTFGSFTLLEPVSLVKVFRLFRLERFFWGLQSVDTVGRCTTSYLLARPACCDALFAKSNHQMCTDSFARTVHSLRLLT
jgi:hypothetical protein